MRLYGLACALANARFVRSKPDCTMIFFVYILTVIGLVLAIFRGSRHKFLIIAGVIGLSIGVEQFALSLSMGHSSLQLDADTAEFIDSTDWHGFSHLGNAAGIPTGVCRAYRVAAIYSYELCAYKILTDARTGKERFLLRLGTPIAYLSHIPQDAPDRMLWGARDLLWFDEDGMIISRASLQ